MTKFKTRISQSSTDSRIILANDYDTTNNGSEPILVDNTSEHGYSYIKIVKLHETHPLVNYDQIQN